MKVLEPWDNFQRIAGPDFGGIKLSDFKKQQQKPHTTVKAQISVMA